MSSSDLVTMDALTVTLHGAGRSDAHEVTLRKTDLSAVALGTTWHLPTTVAACFLGTLSALPLTLAHLVPRWLLQGAVTAIVLVLAAVATFWAARRAELLVRAHNGEVVFRGHYPPWQVDRCIDTFRRLETVMGRRERFVPHPVDARIRLLWEGGHPRAPNAPPTTDPGRPNPWTPPDPAPSSVHAIASRPRTVPHTQREPPPPTEPPRPRRGNPWFDHILASPGPPATPTAGTHSWDIK